MSRLILPFRKNMGLLMACALVASIGLSGCATSQAPKAPVRSEAERDPYGSKKLNVSSAEAIYKRDTTNSYNAARYAKALRESGDVSRAKSILQPFGKKKTVPTLVSTELAAQNLELGRFKEAETAARKAVKTDAGNYRAYHLLGIALDAQQKHEDAEVAFRKALEIWQGDNIPVMNNLALNLAAQGYTDRALDILYKARETDPRRKEIERNIRIIRTLNETATDKSYLGDAAPKPVPEVKPEAKPEAKTEKKAESKPAPKTKTENENKKPVN